MDYRNCVSIILGATNRKILANGVIIILEVNKLERLLKCFVKVDARLDSSYCAPLSDLNLDFVVIWENFLKNKNQLLQLVPFFEISWTFMDRKEFEENHYIA